jgi:hypothetical protein
MGMPRSTKTPWIVVVGLALGALAARGKPLEMPAELLPRAVLEKLYAAELPGYAAGDYQRLYDAHVLLEKYFRTDSAEDRRTIVKILDQTGIPIGTLGRMCRIHLGWPALTPGPAYVNERIGPLDVQYFLGVPKGYDRTKSWPLVIRLPSAGAIVTDPANPPKPDEVVRLYTKWVSEEMAAHPDALLVMPLLNMDEMWGPSYKGMNSVIQAMHHVTTRANVDASRVYLQGHGMAAHAVWNLSLHYSTYFAAINPMAGAASGDFQRVRLMNLRNTLPVVWADQSDKVITAGQSTALVNILKQFKYDVVYELTKSAGHVPPTDVAEKCYQAMRGRQRPPYPQQVNLRSTRPDPTFNRVDWVQVYQPLQAGKENVYVLKHGTGKIVTSENAHSIQAALTLANRVEAKADNVQSLRFYFNDQMVDLAKPVTVVVNGKTRFEGMLKTSLDEMLRDELFLGRGWRYFSAVLDLDLAPASTQPATRATTGAAVAPTGATPLPPLVFFTIDDGKTLIPMDSKTASPTVVEEKQAVRAHVFSCDGGKTSFVGYLRKFSPIVQEDLVRQPGEARWQQVSSAGAVAIMAVKCPEGSTGKTPVEVFPKEKSEARSEK